MSRLSVQDWAMGLAVITAQRATCTRRKVGCVILDENNRVIATGYNGVPSGLPHCIDKPCEGALLKSGIGLDVCQAIHAEQNALMQCNNVYQPLKVYTTTFPCMHCLKMLLNTGIKELYYKETYEGMSAGIDLLFTKNVRISRL